MVKVLLQTNMGGSEKHPLLIVIKSNKTKKIKSVINGYICYKGKQVLDDKSYY